MSHHEGEDRRPTLLPREIYRCTSVAAGQNIIIILPCRRVPAQAVAWLRHCQVLPMAIRRLGPYGEMAPSRLIANGEPDYQYNKEYTAA